MCWTYFKNIGNSLENLSHFQKTLRPRWCPKLVTGLEWGECLQERVVISLNAKGVRKGRVLGLKTPLEHDILQNFITCAKEINCFRILFAC